jgi:hypothetical protein
MTTMRTVLLVVSFAGVSVSVFASVPPLYQGPGFTPTSGGVAAGAACLAVFFYAWQAVAQRRDHVANVYQLVFEKLDLPEIRQARRYVYNMEPDAHVTEGWLSKDEWRLPPDVIQHKQLAEVVARSFDQLGLLVREGVVPINLVAQFYASPALRCWSQLYLYIGECREKRQQNGHMWEWENLVLNTIIPKAKEARGIWKGVYDHDNLQVWCDKILNTIDTIRRDTAYKPKSYSWTYRRWGLF